jgi:pimeloyl-ACP methyl ester carboxylesterase
MRSMACLPVRSLGRWFAGMSLAAAFLILPAAASAAEGGLRCEEETFAVTLSPADPTVYNVFGVLCSRGSLQHKTVLVALHGSTYSHTYWDWPFQSETYSFLRRATAAGYAVLTLDRIGIAQSDHPPAADVTIPSNAYVIHQIVQALRGGSLVVPSFGRIQAERVALVGHSLGSVISIQEAATYDDVDGVVLTGVSHTPTAALGELLAILSPANLQSRFAGRDIPDGYLSTPEGTRSIFYYTPSADPLVIALDEQTRETTTTGELDTAFPALFQSGNVHTPVFVVVGDIDLAFCSAPSCSATGSFAGEAAFYPADACAETAIIPGAGHDLNLHFQAPITYDAVLSWLDRRVGSDTRVPAPVPCP